MCKRKLCISEDRGNVWEYYKEGIIYVENDLDHDVE